MNQKTALKLLHQWDSRGKYLYNISDIKMLFPNEAPKTLQESIRRLVRSGILERIRKGLYIFSFSANKKKYLLEKIAIYFRSGHYNYLSLESALSQYGVISQMPVDRLTVMTTGRKGEYLTPYGVIEFTHTRRSVFDILKSTLITDAPLKIATKKTALRDLKRVGRNLHLIDPMECYENEQ